LGAQISIEFPLSFHEIPSKFHRNQDFWAEKTQNSMEIRICVQKIHEKHHGTPHVPRGFHIPQKILRFSASAKAAQRTQMDMALLLDAGSTATKI
jgi:hypothetical protein